MKKHYTQPSVELVILELEHATLSSSNIGTQSDNYTPGVRVGDFE